MPAAETNVDFIARSGRASERNGSQLWVREAAQDQEYGECAIRQGLNEGGGGKSVVLSLIDLLIEIQNRPTFLEPSAKS